MQNTDRFVSIKCQTFNPILQKVLVIFKNTRERRFPMELFQRGYFSPAPFMLLNMSKICTNVRQRSKTIVNISRDIII